MDSAGICSFQNKRTSRDADSLSMAGGHPIGAMFCALIFGVADAVSNQLQLSNAPADLVLMMPYIVTIVVLVLMSVIKHQRANRKAKANS